MRSPSLKKTTSEQVVHFLSSSTRGTTTCLSEQSGLGHRIRRSSASNESSVWANVSPPKLALANSSLSICLNHVRGSVSSLRAALRPGSNMPRHLGFSVALKCRGFAAPLSGRCSNEVNLPMSITTIPSDTKPASVHGRAPGIGWYALDPSIAKMYARRSPAGVGEKVGNGNGSPAWRSTIWARKSATKPLSAIARIASSPALSS